MYILDPKKTNIVKTGKIRINLVRQDKRVFKNIHFVLLFPFTDLENYISAVIKKENEYTEAGIIQHLKDLPLPAQKIIREDLKFRYFIPEIKDIRKITSKHGIREFDVMTDRGKKIFYLRNVRENLKLNDDNSIVMNDIEKCRYKISNYLKLSAKAREELDRILL